MKFEININDAAEVVLTELGAQVYNKYHERYTHYRPEIYLGQHAPFEECRMIFEKGGR
jgi:hypothetical protein